MKKINLINIITFLFIVLALFIISCDPVGGGNGGNGGGTSGDTGDDTACEATDRDTLVSCIEAAMEAQNDAIAPDLNNIALNTEEGTALTDLSSLFGTGSPLLANTTTTGFSVAAFNGDISDWDVSKIQNFSNMFNGASAFNGDIGGWDVSTGTNFDNMFNGAVAFNGDIGGWDVSMGSDFDNMFNGASVFNQDLRKWDITGDTQTGMFTASAMDYDATNADETSSFTEYEKYPIGYHAVTPADTGALVKEIEKIMRATAEEKKNVPTLRIINTSQVTNMADLFSGLNTGLLFKNKEDTGFSASTFNADISSWDTSDVTDMSRMFYNAAAFNQPIGNWNTSKVKMMINMFGGAKAFNQDINTKDVTVGGTTYKAWNVSAVTNMAGMFVSATDFNQPIGNWNTSMVTNMGSMFQSATNFNQDIGNWNTSMVKDMRLMFNKTSEFDQNINTREVTVDGSTYIAWNTSEVIIMLSMFNGATKFNQDIGNWNTSKVTDMGLMFKNASAFDQNINTKDSTTVGTTTYKAWDVGKVRNMREMFNGAVAFNQDLTGWTWESDPATVPPTDPNYAIDVRNMFTGATKMLPAKFPKVCAEATGTTPYPNAGGCL